MTEELVHLNEVERLSPRVIRILGGNPSKFTLQGTNTYLLGTGPTRLLLDTAEGKPSWPTALSSVLQREKATISTCLLTHWHPDHVGGVGDLQSLNSGTEILKLNPSYKGSSAWGAIQHGGEYATEGATLRALHCPGHTEDHVAFWLEEEGAMFTGDNVLGQGTAVFEDYAAYMQSLGEMEKYYEENGGKGKAYPAHGPVLEDGKAKIREYIEHRQQREREVLDTLEKGEKGGDGWTSMDIVKVVYKDYPQQYHLPAEGGVKQVLEKLRIDGKVTYEEASGDKRWQLSESSSL